MYLPTFVFPNPLNLSQTIIVSQTLDSISHLDFNKYEEYTYEEKRIKLNEETNVSYLMLKKFFKYRNNNHFI